MSRRSPKHEDPASLETRRREYRIGRTFSALVAVGGVVYFFAADQVIGGAAAFTGVFFAFLYAYLLRRLEE